MKKTFSIKKSNAFLFLGLLIIIHAGLILYFGRDVRANPDGYSDIEKLATIFSNFAGIAGIIIGLGMLLAAYIRRSIEKSLAAEKPILEMTVRKT